MEKLIKTVYRRYKACLLVKEETHPDEENLACFFEGRLSQEESQIIKKHLTLCEDCAEAFAAQIKIKATKELKLPEGLILKVKDLLIKDPTAPILEILIKFKDEILELLNTSGDVLVGQELVPAPLLRGRQIKDFRNEITILKDFNRIRAEVKIEGKNSSSFSLTVLVKDKQTSGPINDLRISLSKEDGLELESYITESGIAVFERVLLGKYKVEISDLKNISGTILLDINN